MREPNALDADERLARIQLACLPSMYPNRLRSILCYHSGVDALQRLRAGRRLDPEVESTTRLDGIDRLRREARNAVVGAYEAGNRGATPVLSADGEPTIRSVVRGEAAYPSVLENDPEAPEVLFYSGDLDLLSQRRVGIVGTRNATAAGRATAVQLGSELAAAGVTVVSGLARGIDAAAHRGVRESGGHAAVAVVGSGLDRVYPKVNRALWDWISVHGLLLSEWPPGASPEAWHFPLRNRVIAALSEVVIVVESRESGGSLITVEAALQRGIDVMAVPGSRYCRASTGTNQLIAEGAGLVRDIDDVLIALEMSHLPPTQLREPAHQLSLPGFDTPPEISPDAATVLAVCEDRPATLDQIIGISGIGVIDVARAVTELECAHLIRELNGWIEPTGSRLRRPATSTLGGDE